MGFAEQLPALTLPTPIRMAVAQAGTLEEARSAERMVKTTSTSKRSYCAPAVGSAGNISLPRSVVPYHPPVEESFVPTTISARSASSASSTSSLSQCLVPFAYGLPKNRKRSLFPPDCLFASGVP